MSASGILRVFLDRFQSAIIVGAKIPAVEHAVITLILGKGHKLVRDMDGKWNHVEAPRISPAHPKQVPPFIKGFKQTTIDRLHDAGRIKITRFDERGVSSEVTWVAY